ncbi:MAG: hypothetical protein REI78_02870 [Pedobacter sp.]|nr:hypothetical protein [Pedobacter sp.]
MPNLQRHSQKQLAKENSSSGASLRSHAASVYGLLLKRLGCPLRSSEVLGKAVLAAEAEGIDLSQGNRSLGRLIAIAAGLLPVREKSDGGMDLFDLIVSKDSQLERGMAIRNLLKGNSEG